MNVYGAAYHKIIKGRTVKDKTDGSEIDYSPSDIAIDDATIFFIKNIHNVYSKRGSLAYGEFDRNVPVFANSLRAYVESYEQPKSIYRFSVDNVRNLYGQIKDVALATGGYIFFAHYNTDESNYFLVSMLNHTTGSVFSSDYRIKNTQHIDLKDIHAAARINITKLYAEQDNAISFFMGKSSKQGVAKYFLSFLGCNKYTDSTKETEKLVKMIDEFCTNRELGGDAARKLKMKVNDFCLEQHGAGNPVVIESLAHSVFSSDPQILIDFAGQERFGLSSEIGINTAKLKGLRSFTYAKGKDLRISFSHNIFGSKQQVRYDINHHQLIVDIEDEEKRNELKRLQDA